jgi:DNA-binding response OmpR family regulator
VKKRILSISYDESLLVTRQILLEREGYDVTSAFGFTAAMEICNARQDFDLILMGHSIPQKDKTALIAAIRPKCDAPLLSILRRGDAPMQEASYTVDSMEGPKALVDAVNAVFK